MARSDNPGDRPAGTVHEPVDVTALVEHALRLSQELEEAWSSALDPEALEDAQQGVTAEWSAFVTALQQGIREVEQRMEEAGVDPRLQQHPLDASIVAGFQLDAGLQQRWQQLQAAQIIGLESLMRAVGALGEPSGRRVQLRSGASESWWEGGAFGLVRSRARLLLRVTRELERCQAQLLGDAMPPRAAHGGSRG